MSVDVLDWSPCDDCEFPQCTSCEFASPTINDSLNYKDDEDW